MTRTHLQVCSRGDGAPEFALDLCAPRGGPDTAPPGRPPLTAGDGTATLDPIRACTLNAGWPLQPAAGAEQRGVGGDATTAQLAAPSREVLWLPMACPPSILLVGTRQLCSNGRSRRAAEGGRCRGAAGPPAGRRCPQAADQQGETLSSAAAALVVAISRRSPCPSTLRAATASPGAGPGLRHPGGQHHGEGAAAGERNALQQRRRLGAAGV